MKSFIFFDRNFKKKRLKILIFWRFKNYGVEKAFDISNRIKDIGFCIASKDRLSLGIENSLIQKKNDGLFE